MKKQRLKRSWIQESILYVLFAGVLVFAVDTWRTKDIPVFDVPHLAGNALSGQYLDVMEMSKDEP